MAKGYYSRSPEEFREFLDSLNQSGKKRSIRNIVIFLDIIILTLVFALAVKFLNPGSIANRSNKVLVDEVQVYFTKSNQNFSNRQISYFFMLENTSSEVVDFGGEKLQAEFSFQTEEGYLCYKKSLSFAQKKIEPLQTTFYVFSFPIEIISGWQDECSSLITSKRKPFSWKKYLKIDKPKGGTAILKFQQNSQAYQLSLEGEKW